MIDFKKLLGAMRYGDDEYVIVIFGEFHGPFSHEELGRILELMNGSRGGTDAMV